MAEAEIMMPPTLRVVAPKPRMTPYYALLILALLAMLTACLFLYLEIRRFGGFGAVPERISSLNAPQYIAHHYGATGSALSESGITARPPSTTANS